MPEAVEDAWPYITYGMQGADILPLANIPVFGQVAGQVIDILAFAAAEIDILRSGRPWLPLTLANLSNLAVGTVGNLGSFLTVNQASLIEAGMFGASTGFATGCGSIAYASSYGGKE